MNKKLIGKLPDELMAVWDQYAGRRKVFDKWTRKRIREVQDEIRTKGASINEEHVKFWENVYVALNLSKDKRYEISPLGEIFELEEPNPLEAALVAFIETELPPSLSDNEAKAKLVAEWDNDEGRVEEVLNLRRKIYGAENIKQDGYSN